MDERNGTHKVLEKTSGTLVKLWYKSGVAIKLLNSKQYNLMPR